MRICSGRFDAEAEVFHVQGGRKLRLSQPQQLMAQERKILSEAYAGDIIGVFDPGIFSIGDTVCAPGLKFCYEGIPTFAPEHFAKIRQVDTMKRKQFLKGVTQIAQEGAIQIFQEFNSGMEEIIVGVVGVLQFDVMRFRMESEYGVEIKMENLPYEYIRWVTETPAPLTELNLTSDTKRVKDMKGNPLLLFAHEWSIRTVMERNKGLELAEFSKN
jgi:peptide chain release factor 3